MASGWDFSEVRALAADLRHAAETVTPKAKKSLSKGGLNMKTQMAQEAVAFDSGTRHRKFANDMSYDITGLTVEVGPTLKDIGSVQLLYLSNYKTGPSINDPIGALRKEAGRTEDALGDIGADIL